MSAAALALPRLWARARRRPPPDPDPWRWMVAMFRGFALAFAVKLLLAVAAMEPVATVEFGCAVFGGWRAARWFDQGMTVELPLSALAALVMALAISLALRGGQ